MNKFYNAALQARRHEPELYFVHRIFCEYCAGLSCWCCALAQKTLCSLNEWVPGKHHFPVQVFLTYLPYHIVIS